MRTGDTGSRVPGQHAKVHVAFAVLGLAVTCASLAAGASAQTTPPLIVMGIRYFTGLAAPDSRIESDFTALQNNGYQLVRVWALWDGKGDPATIIRLFDLNGNVNQATLTKLKTLINKAAAHGLTVDLTFDRDHCFQTPPPSNIDCNCATYATLSNYQKGVRAVAQLLPTATYPNLIIDAANEAETHDHGSPPPPLNCTNKANNSVSPTDAANLRAAIRAVTPTRLATVSVAPGRLIEYVIPAQLDLTDTHCCGGNPPSATTVAVNQAQACCSSKPIYFSETGRCTYPGIQGMQIDCSDYNAAGNTILGSAQNCRAAGCTAWVFHTAASYRLRTSSLYSAFLYQVERDAWCFLPKLVNGLTIQPPPPCPPS
jgi:Cellulase (glycosyl hydrolase family 5)